MRRREYGKSQLVVCATCGERATTKSTQGLPSCRHHTKEEYNMKCACGSWLDVKESKYGTFFLCESCGPVSYKKGLEANNLPLKSVMDL